MIDDSGKEGLWIQRVVSCVKQSTDELEALLRIQISCQQSGISSPSPIPVLTDLFFV